jgi:ABC-type multidrug transport system permease subunit
MTAQVIAPPAGQLVALWREHRVLFGRWVARLRREPLALLALLAQPMVWLLLFGHLFAQMASAASVPGGSYLRFMTAGAVVMTTFNASLQGGVELLFDRETGFLTRMLAAPASRISLVTSRFIYLGALTGAQSLIILAAAWLMGVRYASGLGGIAACLVNPMTYTIDALRDLIMTGWQFAPLAGTAIALLVFDACCVAVATIALRHGMR